jgi:hypothetical protein
VTGAGHRSKWTDHFATALVGDDFKPVTFLGFVFSPFTVDIFQARFDNQLLIDLMQLSLFLLRCNRQNLHATNIVFLANLFYTLCMMSILTLYYFNFLSDMRQLSLRLGVTAHLVEIDQCIKMTPRAI